MQYLNVDYSQSQIVQKKMQKTAIDNSTIISLQGNLPLPTPNPSN